MKKIAVFCVGLDNRLGGYEKNTRLVFEGLSKEKGINAHLYKSTGIKKKNEYVQRIPFKNFLRKRSVKKYNNDTTILIERAFTLLVLTFHFFKMRKYDFVYTRNPQTALVLNKLKRLFKYKVVYTNGVKMSPDHIYNIADKIHFNNIEYYENFINKYPDKKDIAFLLPNFNFDLVKKTNIDKSQLKKKYNIPTNKNIISCVGSISKHPKRTDYVVEEFSKLDDNWILILVGKGDKNIIKYANEKLQDRFIHLWFEGNDDSINEIYQISDFTFFASFVDGFATVILESMRNGKLPLCHNRKMHKWILNKDEYLTDLTKEGALKEYIENKGLDWIRSQSEYLISRYNNNFVWEGIKSEYLSLFE